MDNDEDEFGSEAEEMFVDKERHEQHMQQCTLEKGLKTLRKKGEDATLKEIGQSHDRACFEPM